MPKMRAPPHERRRAAKDAPRRALLMQERVAMRDDAPPRDEDERLRA